MVKSAACHEEQDEAAKNHPSIPLQRDFSASSANRAATKIAEAAHQLVVYL
jgi:hypothetical protein